MYIIFLNNVNVKWLTLLLIKQKRRGLGEKAKEGGESRLKNIYSLSFQCYNSNWQVFHKIITSGLPRLQPLYDCLLTVLVNGASLLCMCPPYHTCAHHLMYVPTISCMCPLSRACALRLMHVPNISCMCPPSCARAHRPCEWGVSLMYVPTGWSAMRLRCLSLPFPPLPSPPLPSPPPPVSPYLKTLSMVTCARLMHLMEVYMYMYSVHKLCTIYPQLARNSYVKFVYLNFCIAVYR